LLLSKRMRDIVAGYLFLLPALAAFLSFIAIPLGYALYLSFTEYNMMKPAAFVGFKNWTAFINDSRVAVVYGNTLKYALILVPVHVVFGLLLALGVNHVKSEIGKYVFRTGFYFPVLVTTASVAIAWRYMFERDFGVINYILGLLGGSPVNWLNSEKWVFVSVAIFSLWKFVGNNFLFFLIGLQNIPDSLYDASKIDGTNRLQNLLYITLPLLTPTTFFVIIHLLIGVIQIFDEPFLITGGGPGDASNSIATYIYEVAFRQFEMGYASLISLTLFVILIVITFIQIRMGNRWVHYDQE